MSRIRFAPPVASRIIKTAAVRKRTASCIASESEERFVGDLFIAHQNSRWHDGGERVICGPRPEPQRLNGRTNRRSRVHDAAFWLGASRDARSVLWIRVRIVLSIALIVIV